MGQRCTGRGATYRKRMRRHIPYPECDVELTTGYMTSYIRCMHGIDPEIDWNRFPVSQAEHILQVFDVIYPKGHVSMTMPLSWMTGVLVDLKGPE